jgi:hypothetical protein
MPLFTRKALFLREKSIVREKTRGTARGLLHGQRDLVRERFEQVGALRGDEELHCSPGTLLEAKRPLL